MNLDGACLALALPLSLWVRVWMWGSMGVCTHTMWGSMGLHSHRRWSRAKNWRHSSCRRRTWPRWPHGSALPRPRARSFACPGGVGGSEFLTLSWFCLLLCKPVRLLEAVVRVAS